MKSNCAELASKLFFTLKHNGSRYDLYRDADVSRPVQHENLALEEVKRYSTPGNSVARMAVEEVLLWSALAVNTCSTLARWMQAE